MESLAFSVPCSRNFFGVEGDSTISMMRIKVGVPLMVTQNLWSQFSHLRSELCDLSSPTGPNDVE